jgi:predicted RNA-binding Zn-ribbon protein involved in translation (DUF1610 family)
MSKMITCKSCGKEVSSTALSCPHCGEGAPSIRFRCPKCNSENIFSGQKGFATGKAAVGALLLGPVGLLGGMIGSKKAELVCKDCGNKWSVKLSKSR